MALPTYVGAGAFFANIAGVTAAYPTGRAVDDTLLLFVETADQTIATPSGWTKIAEISNAGQTRLTVFTQRYVSGTGVFVGDSGDHQLGFVMAIRGASGLPHLVVTDSGTETGAGQTQNMDGGTTTLNDCLIVIATAHNIDVVSTTTYSAWTNANLGSVTERFDNSNTAGNGGGVGVATGTLATAGAIGTSTVVNAQTSPAWVSAVIAFSPVAPPINDLFSNAELLQDGLTQPVAGKTYDATTEASEDLTTQSETIDRTQWWFYDAPIRQIVKYRAVSSPASLGWLQSLRGASVSTTSRYATPAPGFSGTSFGQENERGLLYEWFITRLSSDPSWNRAQVDPDYPLLLQVGRRNNTGIVDFTYQIEFESFTPPANDDFDDAEEILVPDLNPIDIAFDLEPATHQPGFAGWSTLKSVGDLWYHLNLATDTPIGIRIAKDDITQNAYPLCAVIWRGSTLGTLTYGGTIRGTYYNAADSPLTQINFLAGQDYYIQLLHDVAQYQDGVETATLHLQPYAIPANNDFADAIDLGTADSGFTTVATTLGADSEVGEIYTVGYSVWYEFTPTNSGWYEFTAASTPASGGWTLGAYRGVAVDSLTWVSGLAFQTHNPKILALHGGETYHIVLDGQSFNFGQLTWDLIAPAPANDDEIDTTVITGASGTQSSDVEGATSESGELDDFYYIDQEATIWFEWVCPSTDYYSFETTNLGAVDYARAITVWETDTAGTPLVANIDGKDTDKGKLAFLATASETYFLRVTLGRQYPTYTFDAPFTFDLVWDTFTPATDNLFANATLITADPSDSITLENYGLPLDLETDFPDLVTLFEDEFGAGYGVVGRARWIEFVPTYTGTYEFRLLSPGSQVLMHFFTGSTLATLVPMEEVYGPLNDTAGTYADHSDDNNFDPLGMELVEGETYWIVTAAFSWEQPEDQPPHWLSQGDFTLSWRPEVSENDVYSQMVFDNNNIGNLNYVYEYQYPGYEGVYGATQFSAGTRHIHNWGATADTGELAVDGYGPVRTLWFMLRIHAVDEYTSDQGDYRIWIEPTGDFPIVDPVMAVYDYNGGSNVANPGTLLGSDDDTNGLFPEVILTNRFGGDAMVIQVDARDEGEFLICWERIVPDPKPANDDFADAIEIFDSVPFAVNAVNATVERGELPIAGFNNGPFGSVWYKFLPTVSQSAQLVVNADWPGTLNIDYQYFDIYRGTTLDNLVNITPADDWFNGAYNEISDPIPFSVQAGETYYFRFSAYADQAWSGVTATMSAFGDDVYIPFISPTTTLYTPSLLGVIPFIAPTTILFDHYLSGAMDIPAPFIDSTAVAFEPYLVSPDRARLSQEAIEVLLVPDNTNARITQVAAEVIYLPDTAKARITQEPIEVLLVPASAEIDARLTQLPVEVLHRSLRESVTITIID